MADLTDLVPLRTETVDTVRARMEASVNAGLDPDDPRWQDTTLGGFYSDHVQTYALEAELLWDYASVELLASFYLPFAWGIYLDYWGEMLRVPRNPPVGATGQATFTTTDVGDVPIAIGTRVAIPRPDDDPLEFAVQVPGTALGGGGTVMLPVLAVATGSEYNAAAGAVTLVTTPITGVMVTNAAAITGGEGEELDEPYKTRLLLEFSSPRGGGTEADYIAETLAAEPSVKRVVVERTPFGPGTVRVIVADVNNNPLDVQVTDRLQAYWDPTPADDGHAPICATVTIATVTAVVVDVVSVITHEPGFSLTGATGTEATEEAIIAAIQDYFDGLAPGRDVQQSRVRSAIIGVNGVYEATAPTLNGVSGDVTIAALEAAQLGTVGLT